MVNNIKNENDKINEYTKIIVEKHKKFKKDMINDQIKAIRDEYDEYVKENEVDFYCRQAIQEFVIWQIIKLKRGANE